LLSSEAFPGQALHATVSRITPKGDSTRKTFRVYLRLPTDTPLRIGMSVEANIIFREKQRAIVVPAEAVAGDTVQVVNNGRVWRTPVRIGIRGSRNVEIVGDVTRGIIVLSPARTDLADGTMVRIEQRLPNPDVKGPDLTADQVAENAAGSAATATPTTVVAQGDPELAVISTAITAHVDSVVNDARRNVEKLVANR
jgi:hypothetical protein